MDTYKSTPQIQTQIFLKMLDPAATSFCFRTFDDVVLEDGRYYKSLNAARDAILATLEGIRELRDDAQWIEGAAAKDMVSVAMCRRYTKAMLDQLIKEISDG